MTFETGTATDLEDLLSKIDTFAQTTHGGYSSIYSPNPDTTNRWWEIKKGSSSMSMRYPASIGAGDSVSIHHATGSTSSATAPGAHTADSGNGYNVGTAGTSANLLSERCISQIGNGPFPSYYLFADDTSPVDYIRCVVEITSGQFRHFGMELIVKFGDNWVGGEIVYGCHIDQATNASPTDPNHQCLLDGLAGTGDRLRAATMRIASGLPNQAAAVWGVSAQVAETSLLLDTAGNVRQQLHGTYRSGMEPRGFGNPIGNFSAGVIPVTQVACYYRDPNNLRVYLLGHMADIGYLNIRNFEVASTITIGSDTWYIFPLSRKTTAAVAGRSLFQGIAYKQVV